MVRLPRNEKQTYRLNAKASNVTIRFDFGHDLDLEFWRSDMEFLTSQPKMVRLPRNEKQTYRLNSRPQMWQMGLTLTMTLTFEFWRSNVTLTFWPYTWHWPWIFMVKFWNSCISEWEGRLTLHKGGGSRSLMAMTMTIWWPKSGVWIYQIVTGVTSVVGVPSTHLFTSIIQCGWNYISIRKLKRWYNRLPSGNHTLHKTQEICFICHHDVIKWKHFRVTGPSWGETTVYQLIPLTKASDTELWWFLWSAPEQTFEQTIDRPVIWDAIALIMTSLHCIVAKAIAYGALAANHWDRGFEDSLISPLWLFISQNYILDSFKSRPYLSQQLSD